MNKSIEIMAPAGDRASLMAALQAGADSIYFGIGQLNMRAGSSNNFQLEDLDEIVALAKSFEAKTYVTLNTILYDRDLPVMRRIIDKIKDSGANAVIASDQAAISYAFNQGVKVHISTQVNISNIEMVEFYSHFADVMVLARELNLGQVTDIVNAIHERQLTGPSGNLVRIEVFAHGALCMAISGKCYLSLHAVNSSANRGACKQQCRHAYEVKAENGKELLIDNEYIMSPKDLCTIDFLDEIIRTGVTVLKIEGRGRSPEYVKTVTRCYQEAAKAVLNGTYNDEKIDLWKNQLHEVYNRGFWDGYYLGQNLGEWSRQRGSQSTKVKTFIGDVLHYYPKAQIAHIRVKAKQIRLNDSLLIIGHTTGVVETKVNSIRVDEYPAETVSKGDDCTIPFKHRVRKGDKVYLWALREERKASFKEINQ